LHALNGCDTWSLKIEEEHALRMFEKRLLKRIFESKWEVLTGGWRK
jgi:hypothetical protein